MPRNTHQQNYTSYRAPKISLTGQPALVVVTLLQPTLLATQLLGYLTCRQNAQTYPNFIVLLGIQIYHQLNNGRDSAGGLSLDWNKQAHNT